MLGFPKKEREREDPDTHLGKEMFMSHYTLGEAVKEMGTLPFLDSLKGRLNQQ